MTTSDTGIPVYVRVGPYNVNPEDAIDTASVISHEYGHSLGLPDYYSGGGRETYGTWNLMATDYSQNMDINGRQELGWVIPRVLQPGQTTTITNWADSKTNTHRIDWKKPDGTPYTLSGPNVANGEAYVAKLPAKRVIDPAKIVAGGSPTHVWWSGSGNDFGCAPDKAHNLDVYLPELRDLPAGTQVKATFKSLWDIEWDFDYGFVMISTDGGKTYTSLPSANSYTTPGPVNPNANACQQQYGNGITGSSGSYAAGTQVVDRRPDAPAYPDPGFLADEYDLSSAVGKETVLRFSYSSDPGLARPGWFIDDLKVTAGATVIYESDFESSGDPDDPRIFSGGCTEHGRTAERCTDGWGYVDASADNPADHAYYLELRDRSGFDFDSHGQADRAPANRRSPAASRSSTRTRHTVTGTPARSTRRRRRCSTRSRSRATTRRTSTTPPGPRPPATTRSPTRAPAGPTTTSIRAPTTSNGTSAGTASRSRCSRCRATETAHVRRRAT